VDRLARAIVGGSSLAFALASGACGKGSPVDAPPPGTCPLVVWYKPSSPTAFVEIVGDFEDWQRPGVVPDAVDGGYRAARLDLTPGEHTYAIVEDGVVLADRNVGTTATHDGQEVTWVDLSTCQSPQLSVTNVDTTADGAANVTLSFTPAAGGPALDETSIGVRASGGAAGFTIQNLQNATISVKATGLPRGKTTLFFTAKDKSGTATLDARTPVWIDPTPFDARDMIIYQVMVDRFANASGPVPPPNPAGERSGGNVDGLRNALPQLATMGVNTIWMSPLYANPNGDFPGTDGREYSSYHGYWPTDARALDPRVATDASLAALVSDAHARGIRIVFDVVPNHVHDQHPYYAQHPDWFDGDKSCVCGVGSCDWATYEQTCWFAPYLPDINWDNADAARQISSDVTAWLDAYDGDGLRIDAVPMMPRSAVRRIAYDVRTRIDGGAHASFLLGEIFTGPGGYGDIREHLGPFELDSSFHFPLMWTLRSAIAHGTGAMSDIGDTLDAADASWAGSGVVPTLIIGNHDVTRFSSESAGDADGDGWMPAPQSTDPLVYEKQRLAMAAIYTLPGAPVVYYGDEVGLAGRSDPDSRRAMPSDAQLSSDQKATRAFVQKLGALRACSPPLRRGTRTTLLATAERYVFTRTTSDGLVAIVDLARKPTAATPVPVSGGLARAYVDALTGAQIDGTSGTLELPASALTARVLLPVGDPCL
jgi:glycosidase